MIQALPECQEPALQHRLIFAIGWYGEIRTEAEKAEAVNLILEFLSKTNDDDVFLSSIEALEKLADREALPPLTDIYNNFDKIQWPDRIRQDRKGLYETQSFIFNGRIEKTVTKTAAETISL